jgi:enediyne biosynthesis protein E4
MHARPLLLLGLLLLAGCASIPDDDNPTTTQAPTTTQTTTRPAPQVPVSAFVDESATRGFSIVMGDVAKMGGGMESITGGIALADYDRDGDVDVYIAREGRNELYRNNGNGTFVEVAAEFGVAHVGPGRAALFIDLDADGWQDLVVVNHMAAMVAYRNTGASGSVGFKDHSVQYGLSFNVTGHGLAAADVDGDGDLDVLVVNYGAINGAGPDYVAAATNGVRNHLYRNDGGRFREVGLEWNLTHTDWSFAAVFHDVDGDRDEDLYVCNDFGRDRLYLNHGTFFTEVGDDVGAPNRGNCMSAIVRDLDGDGMPDIYTSNIYVANTEIETLKGNNLYLRRGDRYEDKALELGAADGGWGWGGVAFDAENDGDVDLLVMNGFLVPAVHDQYKEVFLVPAGGQPQSSARRTYNETHDIMFYTGGGQGNLLSSYYQANRFFLYHNGSYLERGEKAGLGHKVEGRAAVAHDFDRDGAQDILATVWGRTPLLLMQRGERGNYVEFDLVGKPGNMEAIGTTVVVNDGQRSWTQQKVMTAGLMAQTSPYLHFGLASAATIAIEVRWPDGTIETHDGLAANHAYRIAMGSAPAIQTVR